MPQAVEIAYYTLGIRLTQCQVLHHRCLHGNTWDAFAKPCPEYVVQLKFALKSLLTAYQDVARISGTEARIAEIGAAIIDDLIRSWREWSNLPPEVLRSSEFDDSQFQSTVQGLHDFIQDRLLYEVKASWQAAEWFRLGLEIADGHWHDPSFMDRLKQQQTGEPLSNTRQPSQLAWEWSDRETVEVLIREVKLTKDELCKVDGEMAAAPPYDPHEDPEWIKIEVGLVCLKQSHEIEFRAVAQQNIPPGLEDAGEGPPPDKVLKPGYLSIWLDRSRRKIGRDGIEQSIVLSELDFAIVATMAANRDTPTSLKQLETIWGQAGLVENPEKSTIHTRISDLRQKLKPALKLKIKSTRGLGWSLVELDEHAHV